MSMNSDSITRARQSLLWAAKNLIVEAVGAADETDFDAADALVVAVLRVLDGYEAIAQLPDVREIASTPNRPVPFRVERRPDA